MTSNLVTRRRVLRGAGAAVGGMLLPMTRLPPRRQTLQIRCGEMHFARVPREYWTHRLKLIKAMGLNTVCAYLFWNYHEWREGKYDWAGQRDAAEFCRLAQQEGLYVILRPGPMPAPNGRWAACRGGC
jgi:beta-galactosidase